MSGAYSTLSSVQRSRLITYTFVITNVSTLSDTNVVMTGSIPALHIRTELICEITPIWASSGIPFAAGGDYGCGYVSSPTYPVMAPGEVRVLTWLVQTERWVSGNIYNYAHARSDGSALRLTLDNIIYRILLPLIYRDTEY